MTAYWTEVLRHFSANNHSWSAWSNCKHNKRPPWLLQKGCPFLITGAGDVTAPMHPGTGRETVSLVERRRCGRPGARGTERLPQTQIDGRLGTVGAFNAGSGGVRLLLDITGRGADGITRKCSRWLEAAERVLLVALRCAGRGRGRGRRGRGSACHRRRRRFVVDNTWLINDAYPHEADHQGNVNFLTANDLVKPIPAPASDLVADPFINTVTPESTTVATMGKKNANNKKSKAGNMSAPEVNAPESATAVAAPSPEVAEAKQSVATPSDVPGGFPATPSNGNETPSNQVEDLKNKSVSVDPLPASVGLGNPIKLAPGEKIPESITTQNIEDQVKLDKEAYEKSDALPTAPAPASAPAPAQTADVPSVSGTMIPESSLPMGDKTDVTNAVINSVGPDSTTASLAAQVPLASEQSAVPDVVKDSQDKAGVSAEASAVPAEVDAKAEVEEEIKKVVPEVPAASAGTAGDNTEKEMEKEKSSGGVFGAVVAAVAKFSDSATPAVLKSKTAVAETADDKSPDAVEDSAPADAQDAPAADKKETSVDDVSSEVPQEVKDSIVAAGESPEAAASDSAVKDKEAVESELLKEVKEAPAAADVSESTPAAEVQASQATEPVEEIPAEVKAVEETPVEVKPVEEAPVEVKPVEEAPVEVKAAEEAPAEVKPVEEAPVEVKPVEETPAEVKAAEETPAEVKPVEEAPVEVKAVEETPAEVKPVEEAPVEVKAVEETPAEVKPVDETPAETQTAATAAAAVTSTTAETTEAPSTAAVAATETKTNTTEPSAPAETTNDGTAVSESTPAQSSTGDKKKNRFSVMFDKLKAKLK
ncbi:hypothetical protein E4U21_002082 [Claviceps maximensis]|nr:hypothetical protein E4U21_002082 [Claviceps maximensis]